MTSKEAWNKIKEQHKLYTNVEPKMFYGVPIETIERDLEVLEILKKYITELNKWAYYDEKTNSITTFKIISMIDLKPENKDYKTIKEWLDK